MNPEEKKKKELKTLFSNTFMLYVMQISAYIFPLLTFPYLTRVLGPEKYGLMTVANAIINYFQLTVDFGFILSATKECSVHRDNKSKLGELVSSVVQAKSLLALACFAVLSVLVFMVPEFRDKGLYLMLAYLSVALSVFTPDYLFRGLERMHNITYRSIISRALYTVLIFLTIKSPEDYYRIPIMNAVSNLFIVLWSWAFVIKHFKIKCKIVSFKKTWETLRLSSVFFASRIATTIYSSSNVFLLGMVYGTDSVAVGQFSAANSLVSNGKSMFSPIADSLYPYMVTKKNYKLIKIVLLVTAPLILIGTAGLYYFAEDLILLFCGEQYLVGSPNAVAIFRALTPMFIITLPEYILGFPVLGAMNKMKEANYSIMFASVFHIVGLAVLYFTGNLSFIPVCILTCISECVVLGSRIYYVVVGSRELRGGKTD